ncbi:putative ATP-grasp-modified RiPP [Streptomyces sp. BI20]|uniref:putative ATP-grasp-modified RiPP n=1 Tax=Streptomyces sp. BI20 TaxID=3403460 RepID=UPI003C78929C
MSNPMIAPWGTSRMEPYPHTVRMPHVTVTIDPVTQLGVFRDANGQVVEMGKHGTASSTGTSSTTSPDGRPGATDQSTDQDDQQD